MLLNRYVWQICIEFHGIYFSGKLGLALQVYIVHTKLHSLYIFSICLLDFHRICLFLGLQIFSRCTNHAFVTLYYILLLRVGSSYRKRKILCCAIMNLTQKHVVVVFHWLPACK